MTVSAFFWCLWAELALNFRSPAVQISALVLAALCGLSVATGSMDFNARLATFEAHSGAEQAPAATLIRPPQVGAVVVRGSDPFTPDAWRFTPTGVVSLPNDATRGGDSEVGPPFDVAIMIRWFAGLLAVLLGAQTVQSALTSGLCRALAALPAGFVGVIMARSFGVILVMLYVLLVMLSATRLTVHVMAHPSDLSLEPLAVWWLAVPSAAYLVFMVAVGMLIAAVVQAPLRTVMFSALAWLLLALVGPQAVASLNRVWAVESTLVFAPADSESREVTDTVITDAAWPFGHEDLDVLSPGSLLLDASADLMGTGLQTRTAWQSAVVDHHRRWVAEGRSAVVPVMSSPRGSLASRWTDAARPMFRLSLYAVLAWCAAVVAWARLRGA